MTNDLIEPPTRRKAARILIVVAAAIAGLGVPGCATDIAQPGSNPGGSPGAGLTTASTRPSVDGNTPAELAALNCRRITGRMQVRILQVRDRLGETQNPVYAALQSVMNLVQPSNAERAGLDRATAYDVDVLRAQNAALKQKGCPQFDLAKELQPHPMRHTPSPTIAAAPSNGP